MTYLPRYLAQNPAISGYYLGWSSCTAFAAAMAGDFDTLGAVHPTGGQVRGLTGDHTGGLNLAQVDAALLLGWNVNVATVYRLPWAEFAKKINAGCGAILQGGYDAIRGTRFDAGGGFRGNHAVFVAPGWVGMDPLADGRRAGIYKYHGEAYPQAMLEDFAGKLDLGSGNLLGRGLVYAAFTRDNVHTYRLAFPGGAFWVYTVANGVITGRHSKKFSGPTGAPCSAPRVMSWPGHGSRSVVQMTAGALKGQWVGTPQSNVKLELVP